MFFLKDQNVYMSVFRVQEHDKYLDFSGTTSERDRNDDKKFINSYWNVRLIGHAFNTLKGQLKDRDRIIVHQCKISNELFEKDGKKQQYLRVLVMDAEKYDPNGKSAPTNNKKAAKKDDSEGLPF